MRARVRLATSLFVAAQAAAVPARAATAVLAPFKDNTLFENLQGSLSNGAGPEMFVGRTGRFGVRRALVAFPVADSIPAGAHIDSVQLELYLSKTVTEPEPVSVHRLRADWGEGTSSTSGGGGALATPGDATWIHTFRATSFWNAPGGDFAPEASATRLAGGAGTHTWGSTPAMVADVQAWLDAPAASFGWILVGNESRKSAKRFSTRENPTPSQRPRLIVHYTPRTPVDGTTWSTFKNLFR